ncbi:hypothetical protein PF008_g1785 [Phytophthora fragariae]|uniref:Uncharacterized protein n=1 Tax=Phytophthora fragariae TaxID=53985 RepID=A0A6G0SJR0_9STRA|nr:hypothetical protein PF008_g1785 [Phytophthora fragariae]
MEYSGYLSNHLLHGVVALFDLGASEEKIEDFVESYSTKLEEVEFNHEDVTQPGARAKLLQGSKLTLEGSWALLGQRDNFDGLLALYAVEVEELGIDGAVKKHLPGLVGGLAGALLHSIIQLGMPITLVAGVSWQKDWRTCTTRIFRSTSRRNSTGHEVLLGEMRRKLQSKPLIDLEIGGIQKGLSTMSGDAERGSSVAFKLIWGMIDSYDLSKMDGVFAIDLALWLYMMIEHNDFVILHAVTSAWALQQVERLLEPKDRERSWKVWLHVSLSAFVTNEVKDVRTSDVCNRRLEDQLPSINPWNRIVARTLSLADGGLLEGDLVHTYKLVQVAHNHAENSETAFLTAEERDFITRESALKAISLEFGPL